MPMDTILYCYYWIQFSRQCFKWIEGDDGGGSGDEENEAAGWHVKRTVCFPQSTYLFIKLYITLSKAFTSKSFHELQFVIYYRPLFNVMRIYLCDFVWQ